ncbi:hypothetical protein ACFL28_02925 [Candidatus Omnitrophota bacterium]
MKDNLRNYIVIALIVMAISILNVESVTSETVAIKGVTKIQRMGGYVLLINYETRKDQTDNLLFKVYCKFEKGDLAFTSSSLNNVERGWHKTKIPISDTIKKRYGSLRGYRIDLYDSGILVDTRESY